MVKRNFLLTILLIMTTNLLAELPPYYYKQLQDEAPEQLMIKILSVDTSTFSDQEINVKAKAIILNVKHSEDNLTSGDEITIKYSIVTSRPKGWVGPSNLPILQEGEKYIAFLKTVIDEKSKPTINDSKQIDYYPAARGKSFVSSIDLFEKD